MKCKPRTFCASCASNNCQCQKRIGLVKEKLECLLLTVTTAHSACENKAKSQDQFKWRFIIEKTKTLIFLLFDILTTVRYYILQPMLLINASSWYLFLLEWLEIFSPFWYFMVFNGIDLKQFGSHAKQLVIFITFYHYR